MNLPALLVIAVAGGWISRVDAREYRIPDGPVAAGILCVVGFCCAGILSWRAALEGFALAGGQLGLVKAVVREKLGWGDVKYALMLGGLLGPGGWSTALLFSAAGASAAFLAEILASPEGFEGKIPFAPFLTAGAISAILTGWNAS